MAAAVPVIPVASPVTLAEVGVMPGCRCDADTLSSTAAITTAPMITASASVDTAATTATPSAVPGSRPRSRYRLPRQSMWSRSVAAMATAIGMPGITIAPGSADGTINATTGTASRLDPNPTTPCTVDAATTASAITNHSIPDTCTC